MKPGKLDLPVIWRGCTYDAILLYWKDENGDPINLSGWTPRAYTRRFNLNAAVVNAPAGISRVSLNRIQTEALKLGVENWDHVWTQDGSPFFVTPPILSGKVEIKQPITTHSKITKRQLAGGSNYIATGLDPPDELGRPLVPLVGTFHLHVPEITEQLGVMYENGQRQITIFMWFVHAEDTPDPQNYNYIKGHSVMAIDGSLFSQHQQNLADLLALMAHTGFEECHVRMGAQGKALEATWQTEIQPDPNVDRRRKNVDLLINVAQQTFLNRNGMKILIDCGNEYAWQESFSDPVRRQHVIDLWQTYTAAFGPDESCGFSILHGAAGAGAMIELFQDNSLPLPACYEVHVYGSPGNVYNTLTETWRKLRDYGEQQKQIFLGETYYNDAVVGTEVRRALAEFRGLNFGGIHQWIHKPGQTDYDFTDGFPWRFNQYSGI